jgi:hypothetical protein
LPKWSDSFCAMKRVQTSVGRREHKEQLPAVSGRLFPARKFSLTVSLQDSGSVAVVRHATPRIERL